MKKPKNPSLDLSSDKLADPRAPKKIKIKSCGGSARTTLSLEGRNVRAKPRLKRKTHDRPLAMSTSEPTGTAHVRDNESEAFEEEP